MPNSQGSIARELDHQHLVATCETSNFYGVSKWLAVICNMQKLIVRRNHRVYIRAECQGTTSIILMGLYSIYSILCLDHISLREGDQMQSQKDEPCSSTGGLYVLMNGNKQQRCLSIFVSRGNKKNLDEDRFFFLLLSFLFYPTFFSALVGLLFCFVFFFCC